MHSIGSSRSRVPFLGILALLAFSLAPIIHPQAYFIQILCLSMIASILAMGLELVIGFSGQLSIGHGAFYGIGAYTSALLMVHLKFPFLIAFFSAGVVAAIWSLLLVPITRLRDAYLAVSTLGFSIIIYLIILNEEWLTGGPFGLMKIPYASIGGFVLNSNRRVYYLCLVVAGLTYLSLRRIVNSRFGRALESINQSEDAARSCGVNITLYKSKCFIIAAFTAGLAGSLYAHLNLYLNPNDFTFWKSVEVVFMVVVGGMGSLEGAIMGGILIVFIPEYLRASGELRMVIYGIALMVLNGFGEKGLMGVFEGGRKRVEGLVRRLFRPGALSK